jgi:hypothetical protein
MLTIIQVLSFAVLRDLRLHTYSAVTCDHRFPSPPGISATFVMAEPLALAFHLHNVKLLAAQTWLTSRGGTVSNTLCSSPRVYDSTREV